MNHSLIITGHFHETESYSVTRAVGRDDWLIVYTVEGKGEFHMPGESIDCQAGDVTMLKAGTPHRYGTCRGETWQLQWAHFVPLPQHQHLLPSGSLVNQRVMGEADRERIHQAFNRLLDDARKRGDYWNELCMNALQEVLLLLAEQRKQRMDGRIAEVMHTLAQRMHESITIPELARQVALSPSRLSHLFKENTGTSIIETLNTMRIREAVLLMEHTDLSLTDISYRVGYRNYNHFAGQFQQQLGMPPRAYRRKRER
ncbi:helix-turn-helix domain-containing protein [Paenibacillus sp. J5C_2022]|uniref:helix-turn-helix domain-containing protein n=1 Tax=Paenibacillus sp. J5C2022 TaxID=2977129 RepID=UPI0021D069EA|nr:helix-turn-helix domain-containing protein [Paenibacillus sp. J5C2022]MCU6712654.1 helix-turn-helix domain-containing protein [Paenibacillus sp. J5C2022]